MGRIRRTHRKPWIWRLFRTMVRLMKKEKKSTLYPDNRKDFYDEFEDFLLVNSDLILLIGIISILIIIVVTMVIFSEFFQSPYILLNGGV